MTYYIYMIHYRVKLDTRFYVGMAEDVGARWKRHRSGHGAKCLKGKEMSPPAIVASTETETGALHLEKCVKRLTHSKKKEIFEAKGGRSLK